jgi:hypothetical protein
MIWNHNVKYYNKKHIILVDVNVQLKFHLLRYPYFIFLFLNFFLIFQNALSSKVFVGRIKEGTTTMELREFFAEEAKKIEPDSTITDVYIPRPFRSFAFVSFSSPIVAKELIKFV